MLSDGVELEIETLQWLLEDLNFETGMIINHARIIFDRLLGREEKEDEDEHHQGHQ